MLRAILVRYFKDTASGLEREHLFTVDFHNADIEGALRRGGFGEDSYDMAEVIGVEVRDDPADTEQGG